MRGRSLSVFMLLCLVALVLPNAAFAHGIHGEAETIPEFIRLGIRHMVGGWDHLLFIAGAVLLAGQLVRAAKLVSLFVLGHSLTLLIATLAGWQLNAELVDVVIALSLAYIGWRIIAGRPSVWLGTQLGVFGFGLVHGLGLSSRLQDQPLPGGGRLVADILAFNLGVEIGQLAVLSVVITIGYLVKRRAGHLLPPARFAGIGFATVGLIAAAALGFTAARPDSDDGDNVAAAERQCVESQQAPNFEGEATFGGHPKVFHDVDDPANPSDLAHVVGDGYVIVQYRPSLPEDERSSLEEWANQSRGVVVTPTTTPMKAALSAQTAQLNLTCQRLDLEALTDFHSRWFAGGQ
jgi:hydrogenase/urease accessory protein HupE